MKRALTVLLTFVLITGAAQDSPSSWLDAFEAAPSYQPFPKYDPGLCPWQSFRVIGSVTFQIDILLTEEQLWPLVAERDLISNDLMRVFFMHPRETLELVRRGYNVRVHIPGLAVPYFLLYTVADVEDWAIPLDDTVVPDGTWGWYRRLIDDFPGGYALSMRQFSDGTYQLSAAKFLRPL